MWVIVKMERILKIYKQTIKEVPEILLKGRWLESCGFNAGEFVKVVVEGDTIMIKKTKAPKKKQSLIEKINEMTPSKKQKLEKMLEEL